MLKPYTVISKINSAVHHTIHLFDVVKIEDHLLTRLQDIHLLKLADLLRPQGLPNKVRLDNGLKPSLHYRCLRGLYHSSLHPSI